MQIDGIEVHKSITLESAMAVRQENPDYPGVCLSCGLVHISGVEPDAHNYECESCGESAVIGIEDLVLELLLCPASRWDRRNRSCAPSRPRRR